MNVHGPPEARKRTRARGGHGGEKEKTMSRKRNRTLRAVKRQARAEARAALPPEPEAAEGRDFAEEETAFRPGPEADLGPKAGFEPETLGYYSAERERLDLEYRRERRGLLESGGFPPGLEMGWKDALVSKYEFCSGILTDAIIEPYPKIAIADSPKGWASFNSAKGEIKFSRDLILDFPWFVTESFAILEFAKYLAPIIKRLRGIDWATGRVDVFKAAAEKLFLHPFYLSPNVESKALTPNPAADTLPQPSDPEALGLLTRLRNAPLSGPAAGGLENRQALCRVAKELAQHTARALKSGKAAQYGSALIPLYTDYPPDMVTKAIDILTNNFCVFATFYRTYNPYLNRLEWSLFIYGRLENAILARDAFSFLRENGHRLVEKPGKLYGKTKTLFYQDYIEKALKEAAADPANRELTGGGPGFATRLVPKDRGLFDYLNKRFQHEGVSHTLPTNARPIPERDSRAGG
jgi:hypothetical protein